MKWYISAQVTAPVARPRKKPLAPSFIGPLGNRMGSSYGAWVSPRMEVYLVRSSMGHEMVAYQLCKVFYPNLQDDFYETLLNNGWARVVNNLPDRIEIGCLDFNKQGQFIMGLTSGIDPRTKLILDSDAGIFGLADEDPIQTIGDLRKRYGETYSDLLGMGGQQDVWKEPGDFSAYSGWVAKNCQFATRGMPRNLDTFMTLGQWQELHRLHKKVEKLSRLPDGSIGDGTDFLTPEEKRRYEALSMPYRLWQQGGERPFSA